jgi:hypothetical protein
MTKPTRSVHFDFAATSDLFFVPECKDDIIDRSRIWYSAEDIARFQRETLQSAHQLRTLLGSVHPHDFYKEEWINCTGIESLVLFSPRMMRQLQEKRLAHINDILAAQLDLNPSDLSRLSRRSSNLDRQRASVIATL